MNVVPRLIEAAVEFVLWWVGKGLARYFHVQPNYCAEVVLRCVVVGIVTMIAAPKSFAFMDGAFI